MEAAATEALEVCRRLAQAAADAWKKLEGRSDLNEQVAMGADGTPTTRADASLDAAVLEAAAGLGISVLSEEAGLVMQEGSPWLAVVDPLDGSRNAGRGVPFYCTSVAVGTRSLQDLQAGVVWDLFHGTRYEACRGGGARRDGEPVRPRPFDPNEVLVALVADYEDPSTVERMQRNHLHMRDLGSAALEMCLVGTGALDVFEVRRDWLRVIDIAAGALFVQEAGGLVLHPGTGDPLDTPFDLEVRTGLLAAKDSHALRAVR